MTDKLTHRKLLEQSRGDDVSLGERNRMVHCGRTLKIIQWGNQNRTEIRSELYVAIQTQKMKINFY